MTGRVPIFDDHVHLRPDGDHVEAARRYEAAGGTHFMLVHSPHDDFKDGEPDWDRAYARTLASAETVRRETGLRCWVTLGPYPVHLVHMVERFGADGASERLVAGAELAAQHVQEGAAVAIGEVGRPHFEVSDELWRVANETLEAIMVIAKDADCPVMLHTETADPDVMADLASIADRAGLPRERVVKHYAGPLVLPAEHHGLVPSVIASRNNVRRAAGASPDGRFFFETDYIDDPLRKGAVLPIETVPKRVAGFLQSGDLSEETLYASAVDLVEKVYGVETGF